jgi:hypothetical protein
MDLYLSFGTSYSTCCLIFYKNFYSLGTLKKYDKNSKHQITSIFFLQGENKELFKSLLIKALDSHIQFRQFKDFPLDPEFITADIKAYSR